MLSPDGGSGWKRGVRIPSPRQKRERQCWLDSLLLQALNYAGALPPISFPL